MADAKKATEAVEIEAGRPAWRREDGQDLAEYAILIGLIALVVIGAVTLVGGAVSNLFDRITAQVPLGGS